MHNKLHVVAISFSESFDEASIDSLVLQIDHRDHERAVLRVKTDAITDKTVGLWIELEESIPQLPHNYHVVPEASRRRQLTG